jgi:hypothetical protein
VLIYYRLVQKPKKISESNLKNKYYIITILLFFLSIYYVNSQEVIDYSLDLRATTYTSPSQSIHILFTLDSLADKYIFRRKKKTENDWTMTLELDPRSQGLLDTNVEVGVEYEYAVYKEKGLIVSRSHIATGIDVWKNPFQGNILVLIDKTMQEVLKGELSRYYFDLIKEGWFVDTVYVPRTEQFDPKQVKFIKNLIKTKYEELDSNLRTVVLFGRVAVAYSGNIAPDGHDANGIDDNGNGVNHRGAWPADVYYADMDGVWVDTTDYTENTTPVRPEIINMARDGKFDNSIIPAANDKMVGDVELELGRIDFYNLPRINLSETELLRQYLDKNHKYRTHEFVPRQKAVIDDRFGIFGSEAFASNAWSNFSSLVNKSNIETIRFRDGMQDSSYIWAYGCAPGGFTSIQDIAYTSEMEHYDYRSVFTILFGSYFPDWDSENNIYRSILASNPATLTCSWSGRPHWFFHHMGMAGTIGYSTKLTQNNNYFYKSTGIYGIKKVHISLMGDPTLKMYTAGAPGKVYAYYHLNKREKHVVLNWKKSKDESIFGYDIFRTKALNSKFIKLNDTVVRVTNYVDADAQPGKFIYFVRTVKYEAPNSGSFYHHGPASFCNVNVPEYFLKEVPVNTLSVLPTPSINFAEINFALEFTTNSRVVIYDSQGKEVVVLADQRFEPGRYTLHWDLTKADGEIVSVGMYFVQLEKRPLNLTTKLIITK